MFDNQISNSDSEIRHLQQLVEITPDDEGLAERLTQLCLRNGVEVPPNTYYLKLLHSQLDKIVQEQNRAKWLERELFFRGSSASRETLDLQQRQTDIMRRLEPEIKALWNQINLQRQALGQERMPSPDPMRARHDYSRGAEECNCHFAYHETLDYLNELRAGTAKLPSWATAEYVRQQIANSVAYLEHLTEIRRRLGWEFDV